jgi:hypothetical protein
LGPHSCPWEIDLVQITTTQSSPNKAGTHHATVITLRTSPGLTVLCAQKSSKLLFVVINDWFQQSFRNQ